MSHRALSLVLPDSMQFKKIFVLADDRADLSGGMKVMAVGAAPLSLPGSPSPSSSGRQTTDTT